MFKKIFGSAIGEIKTGERKIAIAYPMWISAILISAVTVLWRDSQYKYQREVKQNIEREAACEKDKNRIRGEREKAREETTKYIILADSIANVRIKEGVLLYKEKIEQLQMQEHDKKILREKK